MGYKERFAIWNGMDPNWEGPEDIEPNEGDLPEVPRDFNLDESREQFERALDEVRSEPEIECAHCSGIPDGTISVQTDKFQREHRICNACAEHLLNWL